MKKYLLILGVVLTMSLCACDNAENSEKEVKKNNINVEVVEKDVDEMTTEIEQVYIDALVEIIGNSDIDSVVYDLDGIYVEGRFISYDYIEEIVYNNLLNSI